ncbi:MAG: PAS-domain containing protein [Aliishimia sp.]
MVLLDASTAILIGTLTALGALWWITRSGPNSSGYGFGNDTSLSFLFEDGRLVDASEDAEALLEAANEPADWSGVTNLFRKRFALPQGRLRFPKADGVEFYRARDGGDTGLLEVSKTGRRVRLDLGHTDQSGGASGHKLHIIKQELETLRSANKAAPFPVWQAEIDGTVIWHNPAYAELFENVFRQEPAPDRPLFRLPERQLETGKSRRVPVTPPNTRKTVWYDVQRAQTENGDFYSAVDANAIVHAEAAQRNFVQTLAKTFAHLTIGLAIFDDNRQLVLFNPAVIDLTGLGADFLSSRPNLLSFFDELRNRRLMPEPKNYNSWRQQIADLVAAAADGRYSETWTLDSGRTYRVNGRPHPDGAIAFLIEDISAEVSLTRQFRAELELSQSVLDHLDSSVAVFSSNGVLAMSNAAYRQLWDVDPDLSFADVTIIDCMRDWKARSKASPVWGDLRDFVVDYSERTNWSAEVETIDGKTLFLDATPLVSGTTMVRFRISDAENEAIEPELIKLAPTLET